MARSILSGPFCFLPAENPMSAIDIVTMRGVTPRVEPHLLSDEVAVVARDCHFDHGVISPIEEDASAGVVLPITPTTLFRYGEHWFAWNKVVEAMRSPIAQDEYQRVYYTDGEYPKVTHAQIATGGSAKPTAWYRLGVPAPGVPVAPMTKPATTLTPMSPPWARRGRPGLPAARWQSLFLNQR